MLYHFLTSKEEVALFGVAGFRSLFDTVAQSRNLRRSCGFFDFVLVTPVCGVQGGGAERLAGSSLRCVAGLRTPPWIATPFAGSAVCFLDAHQEAFMAQKSHRPADAGASSHLAAASVPFVHPAAAADAALQPLNAVLALLSAGGLLRLLQAIVGRLNAIGGALEAVAAGATLREMS